VTADRMLGPSGILLDRFGGRVKPTVVGDLPPGVVRMIADKFDLGSAWIGAGNREEVGLIGVFSEVGTRDQRQVIRT
jgi:hypothetical protein